jgi:hypothetical protein
MAKIDTSGWKPFVVGDLFDIHPTNAYKMTNAQLMDDGENPVVVNSSYNNGIGGYSSQTVTEKGGLITFSDTTTADAIFYQPNDFVGYPHVQGMYPKGKYAANWQESQLLFFVVTFRKAAVLQGFDYAYKFTREIASNMEVLLPVDASGEPDWAYMDEYMSAVMRESEASLESLRQADESKHALDIAEWQEFVIGNLFEPLESGFVGEGRKIGTATTSPDKEHTIPLTAAKNDNNGIMYWGRPGDYITYSNVIAVIRDGAVSTGRVFAQKNETGTYSHSYFIRVKGHTVSFLTNLFLSRVLEAVIYPRYTRDDACIWERIVNDTILLPADTSGEPDWVYMDEYMRTIMENAASDLLAMQSIG